MSIASLSRFTVPVPGGPVSDSFQGLLMPKLRYRFRVLFTGFGPANSDTLELTKQVMNVSRPELSFDDIKLSVYNSTVKLPGKYTWADTKVTLRDDATNRVTSIVGQQVQKQFDFYEQSSAASAGDFKFTMSVEMLDGGNGADNFVVLERFDYIGCYIKRVKYQDGDYSNATETMDIALDIAFDNCLQYNGETNELVGIGATLEPHLLTSNLAVGG